MRDWLMDEVEICIAYLVLAGRNLRTAMTTLLLCTTTIAPIVYSEKEDKIQR